MVEYKCFRCNYITNHKNSFKNHLNRKNICKPLLDDIDISELKKWYKIDTKNTQPVLEQVKPAFEQAKPGFLLKSQPGYNQAKPAFSKSQPGYNQAKPAFLENKTCNFCQKTFTRVYGLTCHLKTCKIKKQTEENTLHQKTEFLEMKKELEELKKTQCINNTSITNNNINNTNNIININNYGCENLDYINKDYLTNLLKGAFNAIPKLIENIHFNPKHPENHNIKITNKKEPYIKVRKDNKWQLQDKKETIDFLVDDKYYLLDDHFKDIDDDTLKTHTKSMIEEFLDRFNSDEELLKTIQRKTEMTILNNRTSND